MMRLNKDQDFWASVHSTKDFVCVDTYSGLGLVGRDPLYPSRLLLTTASEYDLGESILEALSNSRTLLNAEERVSFFDQEKSNKNYADWVGMLMEKFGHKTKKSLFKDMKNCSVHCINGVITISPTRHEKLEGWGRTKGDGIEDVILSVDSSPAQIGEALRLALSRCKG